ncbi:MAG TPA: O-antigen ligase family protein [Candidatus Dormibacteraeota bacterium]|nr:O-antigen ligase family protein [Candidatus Dormibacteraeota bacterium]
MSSVDHNMHQLYLASTRRLFRQDFLLDTPASRAFLFFTIIFIVSPLSLYFNRLFSLLVVFGFILASLFFLVIPKFSVLRARTPIDLACAVFLGYMSLSCVFGLISGHLVSNTIADLVSPLEIYLCFQIAKRIDFSKKVVLEGWLKWILVLATARASWQVFTTLAQIRVLAPIYDASSLLPMATIGRFTYLRPIDPISGIMLAIALMFYIFGFQRKWSLVTAIVTAAVVILGLTRSEWIAGVLAVFVAMFYGSKFRKTIKTFVVIGLILAAILAISPDLYQALTDRLITRTVDQITSSDVTSSEDITVGALRILEFGTAIEKFHTAPIFGHGLGSWFGTIVSYDGRDRTFVQLHNSYLNLLTNTGLVGVSLLLIVMLKVRKFLLFNLRHKDVAVRVLFCVGAGSLTWYGIFMAFEPIYSAYHLPALIGTIWGLATRMSKISPEQAVVASISTNPTRGTSPTISS